MHAHKISVLSNIQFKLSSLFTFSILTTIIAQESFFSLQWAFIRRGVGVITQAILFCSMPCSKALSPLFPLCYPAPSGRPPPQQTAISRLSVVSLIRIDRLEGAQAMQLCAPRNKRLMFSLPRSHLQLLMSELATPASSISHTDTFRHACKQAK